MDRSNTLLRRGAQLLLVPLLLCAMSSAQAATISVTGACTLAKAIDNANDGVQTHLECSAGTGGADTIQLTSDVVLSATDNSTVDLGSTGTPSITSIITLDGQGYKVTRDLALAACNRDGVNDADEFRLMYVAGGATLTLQDIFLENGCADGTGLDAAGGGVFVNQTGALAVHHSSFDGNEAELAGGAIFNYFGTIPIIIGSTFSVNRADVLGGGAIRNLGTITIISNSTFSGNIGTGAALQTENGDVTTIINSTFSGNDGSSTIFAGSRIDTFTNNIITQSTGADCSSPPAPPGPSNNLGDDGSCGGDVGDVTFFDTTLKDNGCASPPASGRCVKTHALQVTTTGGSNAIDKAVTGTTEGQRGYAVIATRDIGAYEYQLDDCTAAGLKTDGFSTFVDTAAELHQGMLCANYNGPALDLIRLAADIVLTGESGTGVFPAEGSNGTRSVLSPMYVEGRGFKLSRSSGLNACNRDGINDADEFRLMHVAAGGELFLGDIFLENGCADGTGLDAAGGGVFVFQTGTLSVLHSSFDGNEAEFDGGAIFNYFGTIPIITGSTFSANRSDSGFGGGGAIRNFGTITIISNSTFSGNIGIGAALQTENGDVTTIINSTFSGNDGSSTIFAGSRIDTFTNNIITQSTGTDCSSPPAPPGPSNNLGDDGSCGGDVGDVTFFDTTLKDNGCAFSLASGRCVKTHALQSASNAIDAAVDGEPTDQRKFDAFNGRDIGAWESADQDSDNLGEADEVGEGTDPYDPDSDGDGLNDGDEILAGTEPLQPDTDGDGIRDGLDPMPAAGQGSDDNFSQCEDVSDGNPSTIIKNTVIADLVLCADPDGIVVGEGDSSSPVRITPTGELIIIAPGGTEFMGPFEVDLGGQVKQLTEPIPVPPSP